MNNEKTINNTLNENDVLDDKDFYFEDEFEDDKYQENNPDNRTLSDVSDNRVWKSYVEDIDGGDNFGDYCEYFFKMLIEEEYYDD